jgi:hypothetical protein
MMNDVGLAIARSDSFLHMALLGGSQVGRPTALDVNRVTLLSGHLCARLEAVCSSVGNACSRACAGCSRDRAGHEPTRPGTLPTDRCALLLGVQVCDEMQSLSSFSRLPGGA